MRLEIITSADRAIGSMPLSLSRQLSWEFAPPLLPGVQA